MILNYSSSVALSPVHNYSLYSAVTISHSLCSLLHTYWARSVCSLRLFTPVIWYWLQRWTFHSWAPSRPRATATVTPDSQCPLRLLELPPLVPICTVWSSPKNWLLLKLKLVHDRTSVGQCVLVSGLPSWTYGHIFLVCLIIVGILMLSTLSDERMGLYCTVLVPLLLSLNRAVTLGSKSCRTHDHILLSHLRLPQPGVPSPCIYIPEKQGSPVIPRALGSPFASSYNSQDYNGGAF
jgi:hypothetical protein